MATALQIQTLAAIPSTDYGCSHWLGCTASPKEEARALFAMIGRNGVNVESIRELIAVPAETERALRLYLHRHPEDAEGVQRVLEFRIRVAEQFERLIACCGSPSTATAAEATHASE
jgi:hypothetical protein